MDFFHRFRFVFLGAVIAITAPLVTLSIMKGNITDVSTFEASYTYGQGFTYSGSAFMGEVSFEFRKKGDTEWTTEEPRYVGDYEVRAKSKGNYGYKYSAVTTFSIDPKEVPVTIKNNNINFGDDSPALTYELLPGDTLNKDYIVNYADLTATTTTASLDLSTLKVTNKENKDVTDCYTFTTEDKEISFNKQTINIKFADDIVTKYDGNDYANDEWEHTSGNLFYDAQIVVDGGLTVSEIGTYNNEHRVRVMKDDIDYSANYDIKVNDNSIRIDKAPAIRITTNSLEKVYDGKPFEIGDRVDTVDGTALVISEGEFNATVTGLLPIHHIEVEFTTADAKSATSGINNEISYRILDKDNNDVADLYENVIVTKGTLEIARRPITFKAQDLDSIYDATYQFNDQYDITDGSLADDEYEELQDDYTKQLAPVENLQNVQRFKIYHSVPDGDDIDVTANYDLTTINGTINIAKREIDIKSKDLTVQYDNIEKSQQEYEFDETTLASGDTLSLDTYTKQTNPTKDLANEHTYKIVHENEDGSKDDVTSYYKINDEKGKINILVKPLEFEFTSQTFEYDADPHCYYTGEESADGTKVLATLKDGFEENLPEGFTYEVSVPKTLAMTNYDEDGYTAKESDVDVKIFDASGKDVHETYEAAKMITYDLPTSKITKKDATVTVSDYEKVYDDKSVKDTMELDSTKLNTVVSATGIISGQHLKVEYPKDDDTADVKNVKSNPEDRSDILSSRIALTYSIRTSKDVDVTSNYNITFENDKETVDAKITRKAIHLTTDDVSKVYDEKNTFTPKLVKPTASDGALGTETFEIDKDKEYTVSSDDAADYLSYDALKAEDITIKIGNEDVTDNYDIYLETAGKLTIEKRDASIFTTIDYNSNPNGYIFYDKKDHGVYVKDDGTYSNEIRIEAQNDNLTKPRGFIDGHKVIFDNEDRKSEPDTGMSFNGVDGNITFGTQVLNANDVPVTKNYTISHSPLNFIIKKNIIEVSSKDVSKKFDNAIFDTEKLQDFDFNEFYDYDSLVDAGLFDVEFKDPFDATKPLQPGHKLKLTKYTSASASVAKESGSYSYDYSIKVVDENLDDVSDQYSIIKHTDGQLVVNSAKVTLFCDRKSRNYDGKNSEQVPTDEFIVSKSTKSNGAFIDSIDAGPAFENNFTFKVTFGDGGYDPNDIYRVGLYSYAPALRVVDNNTETDYAGGSIITDWEQDNFYYSISKRPITIVSRTINGKEMRYITGGSLASGDVVKFGDEELVNREFHEYTNELKSAVIIKDGSIDVTDCYSITITRL